MNLIIALRDGDEKKAIPIMSGEDDDVMALFTDKEAKEFCLTNLLCQHSTNIVINITEGTVDYQ